MDCLAFVKQAEDMPAYAMIQMVDTTMTIQPAAASTSVPIEYTKVANARTHRTR
jgi:hypothetical protein